MRFSCGIYLAGDSFPHDMDRETEIRRRLSPRFARWHSQQDVLSFGAGECFDKKIRQRVNLLQQLLPDDESAKDVVLFGRSSGARTATLFAASRPVRAIVCFAYPFRHPKRDVQPNRFQHLAQLQTPTLIFQGRADEYGSESIRENYPLSEHVMLEFVDSDHAFRLDPQGWDFVAAKTLAFLKAHQPPSLATRGLRRFLQFGRRASLR